MTTAQGTITAALRYAWTLFRSSWRRIWAALALNALAQIVLTAGVAALDPAIVAAGWAASVFTGVMLFGAIYQIALKPTKGAEIKPAPAHHGFQWRVVEWRLLAATVLVGVFTGFMLILGLLIWGSVLAGVLQAKGIKAKQAMTPEQLTAALGSVGFGIVVLAFVLLGLVATFIRLRLSLAWPATVAEDGVRVLQTWKLTRGRVLQIFAAMLVVCLPFAFLVQPLASAILTAGGATGDANEVVRALRSGVRPPIANANAILAAAVIGGGLRGFIQAPLLAGIAAHFYLLTTGAAGGAGVTKPLDR